MRSAEAMDRERERLTRKTAELNDMMREYSDAMKASGMAYVESYPRELVQSRRLWDDMADSRSLTGRLMGDPLPERSALGGRQA